MAWGESKAWMRGSTHQKLYQSLLENAIAAPARNAKRRKILHPEDMPWEMSRQGLLKHLLNEQMNTRMETVDAYMQIIPAGSRSGRHRHLAEECLYVVEGRGYDLHQDCDVEITDTYHWKPQAEVKRWEWEAGDVIYIPPNTMHQQCNASAGTGSRSRSGARARTTSCAGRSPRRAQAASRWTSCTIPRRKWSCCTASVCSRKSARPMRVS